MLKEQKVLFNKIAVYIDCFIVISAFLLAYLFQSHLNNMNSRPLNDYLWIMISVIPLWIGSLKYFGMYQTMREKESGDLFLIVIKASILATIIFSSVSFLLELEELTRGFIATFFVATITMLLAEKGIAFFLLHYIRRRGYNNRVILIAGSGARARAFAEMVTAHPNWGLHILGFVDEEERFGMAIGDKKVMGSFKDLSKILDENVVDEVIFILPRKWVICLEECIKICEKVGVKATVSLDLFNLSIAKTRITEIHGLPLMTLDTTPYDVIAFYYKRFLDFIISGCCLILLSPLFLVIALIIKMTSEGPVLFRQTRCGLNGRKFILYKFRTMVVDAEARLNDLIEFNERKGPVFKMRNDPRITGIGRFLRRTSLDEIPQFFNVFKGDMALVGPRPPLPSEVERYERWQRRRLSFRPGMACIHEVIARNDKDFDRWMELDLKYIDNWSFSLDAKILTGAILSMFRGSGS